MVDAIIREDAIARTPISRPTPGTSYQHLKHGYVTVEAVEDGVVVFTRPLGTDKHGYINMRQQPIKQFQAQTVDARR